MANLGNAWHIPDADEPPGESGMRSPVEDIHAETAVTVVSGSQFRGGTKAGNQLQAGSTLFFRRATDAAWASVPLRFLRETGNNKYFTATIPANRFRAGDVVQYYLKLAYSDRDTTFLTSAGLGSATTAAEADARAEPFSFDVRETLRPVGPIVSTDQGPVQGRVYRDTGHVEVAGPDLAGAAHATVLSFAPPSVRLAGQPRSVGRVRTSTPLANGLELEQELGDRTIRTRLTFPHPGVLRYEVVDWGGPAPDSTSLAAASDDRERFYGLGEKFNALDQSGRVARMETFDQPGNKGDRSYKVVPWFVSTRGYGFHFDSPAEAVFDLRATRGDRYSVVNPSGRLAFNVVYGPRMTDVLTRFTAYAGRPPLPPPFAFGPWISSDVWRNGGEVRYVVSKSRERGLPASVFVFDSPWETAYNDFAFNMTQFGRKGTFEGVEFDGFASLREMMTFLQRNGLKVVCWMTPFVNEVSRTGEAAGQLDRAGNLDDGRSRGVFVRGPDGRPLTTGWWKGRGSHVDFTSPAARAWLQDQLRALVRATRVVTRSGAEEPAIGGFKTDDGEAHTNENSPDTEGGTYIRDDFVFADGRTGREMRNGYCVEYHRAVWEVLGEAGLIFARSGFTGTQAFPGCWAGDNEPNFGEENGLPSVIAAGLSAAMSGFSIWGHDIGGYLNNNRSDSPADLFRRWTQFGCFSPIMQMHRQVSPDLRDLRQHPWGYAGPGETPARNGPLDHYRFYAKLHTALFPYIYTYAKRSAETGLPILRPLVLMHQDDPRTHPVRHTYYFGEEFLVAPMIRPDATRREVYLPKGEWVDFWSNSLHPGGGGLDWGSTDRSRFPLFVRRGSVVPMLLAEVGTLCDANYVNNPSVVTPDDGLLYLIYPGEASEFVMYDGTIVRCEGRGANHAVTLTSVPRPVVLKILSDEPAAVTRSGASLTRFPVPANWDASNSNRSVPPELAAAEAGWLHAATARILMIKFHHPGGVTRIEF